MLMLVNAEYSAIIFNSYASLNLKAQPFQCIGYAINLKNTSILRFGCHEKKKIPHSFQALYIYM